ncbi:Sensor protein CzcS precursor [compost metagenome]
MGHDNLYLSIFTTGKSADVLINVGGRALDPTLRMIEVGDAISYTEWADPSGDHFLSASQLMKLNDGDSVRVSLSLDRASDEALLQAYLRATLVALPFLLLLIGAGAWWIVRRGLAPMRQFRRIASRVSTQDLTHRIELGQLPRELGELADGLNVMLHRLDGGVQQLSQFSDDLAHELRTPIGNLMGKAQVTLSRERSADEYKTVLASSIEELERVARIVSDMLFLAHVSHPASLVAFEEVALEEEVERVMELFGIVAEEKRLRLLPAGQGRVFGDRLMIQRALSNLLSNAIRHSPPERSIFIDISASAGRMTLAVSNSGAGIPQQHIPHLFERFYRVERNRSGTGLGLAIVRSIMSLHHGTVEVSSQPEGPTVFSLNFPRHARG